MGKNKQDTSTKGQIDPKQSSGGQELTTLKPEVKPVLKMIATGYMKFDPKWKASPFEILIRGSLLNDEGSKLDEHPILGVGSVIDAFSSLSVVYKEGSIRASVRAVPILTPKLHYIVNGVNTKGELIDLTLKSTGKNEEGQEVEVDYTCKADCLTSRFLIRDLTARLLKILKPAVKDETLTLAQLLKREIDLKSKASKIASQISLLDPSKVEEKSNLIAILDPLVQSLNMVQGQIEQIKASQKVEQSQSVEDILAQALKRVLTPTIPEVKPVASTQP